MGANEPPKRRRAGSRWWLAPLAIGLLSLPGCAQVEGLRGKLPFGEKAESKAEAAPAPRRTTRASKDDTEIYQRALRERSRYLELEVDRLRADLRQAEEAMVAIESGPRDLHTRADAVSALAEARISVERATKNVSWRKKEVNGARAKLEEAERQFQKGHAGSSVFFASRAQRMADTLNEEARRVALARDARFVKVRRVNLRAGPSTDDQVIEILSWSTPVFPERRNGRWLLVRTSSGHVGWLHEGLVRQR